MACTLAHLLSAPLLAVLGLGLGLAAGPVASAADGLTPPSGTTHVWPLDPRPEVAEGFAPPTQEWGAGHRGVDLRGSPGQAVRAARDGTVTFAGMLAGRGVVVVDHGATRTTYEPVDASVAVGDRVRAGQRIGSLGLFGSHCWPRACLHWGLIEGETYLDPLSLVGAGPVRLLPLHSDLPLVKAPAAPPILPPTRWSALPPTRWSAPWAASGLGVVRPGGVLAGRPGAAGLW
ncbi:MAG TPA: M23 family metallopeptidase [Nocardioidaceae bacterium]|nr:M23 family metallopeptidase [Nocardioidaceae bacterium]